MVNVRRNHEQGIQALSEHWGQVVDLQLTTGEATSASSLSFGTHLGSIRDECCLRQELSDILPIRLVSVMPIDIRPETRIGHVWPIVFVESRSFFQHRLVDAENKLLVDRIEMQRLPRNSEQLIPNFQKASE